MNQVGGNHYSNKKIEPIEFIERHRLPFSVGNIIKYLTRWKEKGGVEDLRKARQYLDFMDRFNVRITNGVPPVLEATAYSKDNNLGSEVERILFNVVHACSENLIEEKRQETLSSAKSVLDKMIEKNIHYVVTPKRRTMKR